MNSTGIIKVLGTDVWDLTFGEWEGRRQMRRLIAFFRRYVPEFEKSFVAQSGIQIGVRETRRIVGEYEITAEDILKPTQFHDAVAYGTYPIDVHNPEGRSTSLRRIPDGCAYSIPPSVSYPQRCRSSACGRSMHFRLS